MGFVVRVFHTNNRDTGVNRNLKVFSKKAAIFLNKKNFQSSIDYTFELCLVSGGLGKKICWGKNV